MSALFPLPRPGRLWLCAAFAGLLGCQSAPHGDVPSAAAQVLQGSGIVLVEHGPESINASEPLGDELTLARALRLAVQHDPRIQAAIAAVRAAEADALQIRLMPNPILTASVRFREAGGDPVYDIGLAGDLLWLLQRPRKVSAADAHLRASVSDAIESLLDVLEEVQEAYNNSQGIEEELQALKERQQLTARLLKLGEARLKAGEAAGIDVIALQTQQLQSEVDVEEKLQEQTEAALNLARLIGQPSAALTFRLAPRTALSPITGPESQWIDAALRSRPDLRAKRWELAALGDERALTELAWIEGTQVGPQAEWDQDWTVGPGITMPLPIFDWGQAKNAKASAELMQARHQMTQLQRQAIQEVRTQYLAYSASLSTLAKTRQQLVPLLEKRADLTRKSYQAGETDVANLLLAEEDLIDGRMKMIALQRKTLTARAKLQRSVGGFLIPPRGERSPGPATLPSSRPSFRP